MRFSTSSALIFSPPRFTTSFLHPLLRLRLAHLPRPAQARMVALKVHAFRRLAALAREEIRWAEEGLALLDQVTPKKAYVTKVTGYR